MLNAELNSSLVSKDAKSTNYCLGLVAQIAVMSKWFSLVNITDVDLDERDIYAR